MRRRFGLGACSLLLVGMSFPTSGAARQTETGVELAEQARRVLRSDLERWQHYAFHREVERRRLDDQGEVAWTTSYRFLVSPPKAGSHRFDEQLLRIDGRVPTEREVSSHRGAARFSKHYRQALEERSSNLAITDGLAVISTLLELSAARAVGREKVGGVDCHRLELGPGATPGVRVDDKLDRLLASTTGQLWVTVDGLHTVRAKTRLVEPFEQATIRVRALDVELRLVPVDEGWLPSGIELRSDLKVLFQRRLVHNSYRYTGHERQR